MKLLVVSGKFLAFNVCFGLKTKLTFVLYSSDLQGHMETVSCDVVLKLLQ